MIFKKFINKYLNNKEEYEITSTKFNELKISKQYNIQYGIGEYPHIVYPVQNLDIVECIDSKYLKEHKEFKSNVFVAKNVNDSQNAIFINNFNFYYSLNCFKRIALKDIDEVEIFDECVCISENEKNIKFGEVFTIIKIIDDEIHLKNSNNNKIISNIKHFKFLANKEKNNEIYIKKPVIEPNTQVLIHKPNYYNKNRTEVFYFSHFDDENNICCYENKNSINKTNTKLKTFKYFKTHLEETLLEKMIKEYEILNKIKLENKILEEYKKEKQFFEDNFIYSEKEFINKFINLDFDTITKKVIKYPRYNQDNYKFIEDKAYNDMVLIHLENSLKNLENNKKINNVFEKYVLFVKEIIKQKRYCFLNLNNIIVLTELEVLNLLEEYLNKSNDFSIRINLFEEKMTNINMKDL